MIYYHYYYYYTATFTWSVMIHLEEKKKYSVWPNCDDNKFLQSFIILQRNTFSKYSCLIKSNWIHFFFLIIFLIFLKNDNHCCYSPHSHSPPPPHPKKKERRKKREIWRDTEKETDRSKPAQIFLSHCDSRWLLRRYSYRYLYFVNDACGCCDFLPLCRGLCRDQSAFLSTRLVELFCCKSVGYLCTRVTNSLWSSFQPEATCQ